jgi:hypothetical protein
MVDHLSLRENSEQQNEFANFIWPLQAHLDHRKGSQHNLSNVQSSGYVTKQEWNLTIIGLLRSSRDPRGRGRGLRPSSRPNHHPGVGESPQLPA